MPGILSPMLASPVAVCPASRANPVAKLCSPCGCCTGSTHHQDGARQVYVVSFEPLPTTSLFYDMSVQASFVCRASETVACPSRRTWLLVRCCRSSQATPEAVSKLRFPQPVCVPAACEGQFLIQPRDRPVSIPRIGHVLGAKQQNREYACDPPAQYSINCSIGGGGFQCSTANQSRFLHSR
jgi:hypothetical protein